MLAGADLRPGDRVLELASGPGGVGLAAAALVGADGAVVISDVVPGMVEAAAARVAARGATNVRTAVLDLEAIDEPDESFEAVLCREGIMFAFDPAHAASEMHRVLAPRGRVAVATWAEPAANPWLGVLFEAITECTDAHLPRPGQPGPFALGDADLLRQLFTDAGFTHVGVARVAAPLRAPSFDALWTRALTLAGPVAGILNGLDDATRTQVRSHIRQAVERYEIGAALELPAVALVLTGRRS
jgi:ubiquinone/menaquinone biosynthesis C-methylase UbiE